MILATLAYPLSSGHGDACSKKERRGANVPKAAPVRCGRVRRRGGAPSGEANTRCGLPQFQNALAQTQSGDPVGRYAPPLCKASSLRRHQTSNEGQYVTSAAGAARPTAQILRPDSGVMVRLCATGALLQRLFGLSSGRASPADELPYAATPSTEGPGKGADESRAALRG